MAYAKAYTEQIGQVGVEVTPGVAQQATLRFNRAALTVQPDITTSTVRASGSYLETAVYRTMEASKGDLKGTPDFNELKYILDLVFGASVTTTVHDGTADSTPSVYSHVYTLKTSKPTWTVEFGDTEAAITAVYMFATALQLDWGKNSKTAAMNLTLAGGKYSDGATLSTAATGLAQALATSLGVSVSYDASWAGLGTTKINAISTAVKLDSLARGEGYLDGTESIGAVVNTPIKGSIDLMVPADAAGRAFLGHLRSNDVGYIRIANQGAVITGTNHYSLTIDTPVQVSAETRDNDQDAYVVKPTLNLIKDTDGKAITVTLVNTIA